MVRNSTERLKRTEVCKEVGFVELEELAILISIICRLVVVDDLK
jgi:hypothetical protein